MFPIIRASTPIYGHNKGMVTYTETKRTYSITIQQDFHAWSLTSMYQSIATSHWWAHLTGKHLQWKRRKKKKNLTDFFWRKVSFINRLLALNLQDPSSGSWDIECVFRVFTSTQTCGHRRTHLGFHPAPMTFFFFPFLSCSGSLEFKFLKPSMSFWQRILVSAWYTCFLFQGQWNVRYVVTHNK